MDTHNTKKCEILIKVGQLLTRAGNIIGPQEIAITGNRIIGVGKDLNFNPTEMLKG